MARLCSPSAPLGTALTPYVAAPVLVLLACFGLLVAHGTPLHRSRLGCARSRRGCSVDRRPARRNRRSTSSTSRRPQPNRSSGPAAVAGGASQPDAEVEDEAPFDAPCSTRSGDAHRRRRGPAGEPGHDRPLRPDRGQGRSSPRAAGTDAGADRAARAVGRRRLPAAAADMLSRGHPHKARTKANDAVIAALTQVLEQFDIDARSPASPAARRSPATRSSSARRSRSSGSRRCSATSPTRSRVRRRPDPRRPIPGKSAIGIEIPNTDREIVSASATCCARRSPWPTTTRWSSRSARTSRAGIVVANLAKMPHILVAGATGAGKSSLHQLADHLDPARGPRRTRSGWS